MRQPELHSRLSRGLRLLLAVVALSFAAAPPALAREEDPDNVEIIKADDQAILRAQRQAKASLPGFWARVEREQAVRDTAVVKMAFITADGRQENMWLRDLTAKDGVLTGVLDNEPILNTQLKLGQRITIDPDRILDWGYERDGVNYGFFMLRVQMTRMTAEEKANVGFALSDTPIEP